MTLVMIEQFGSWHTAFQQGVASFKKVHSLWAKLFKKTNAKDFEPCRSELLNLDYWSVTVKVWDESMASAAQTYAEECIWGHGKWSELGTFNVKID